MKAYGWILLFVGIGAVVSGGVYWYVKTPCWRCVVTPNRYHPSPTGYERGSSPDLKAITSAEADFSANDRDGDGKQDFWRKDVSGLYASPGADGKAVKLIELRVALADDHSLTPMSSYGVPEPRAGYWYRSMLHEGEDPKHPDPQRFAFAAIPVTFPRHSKFVYIVDERYTVFRSADPADLNVTVFPKDLSTWSKID